MWLEWLGNRLFKNKKIGLLWVKINYTKELLQEAVSKVFSFSDVCRYIGLNPHSGNIKTIHRKVDEYSIDTSHFTRGKRSVIIEIETRRKENSFIRDINRKFYLY